MEEHHFETKTTYGIPARVLSGSGPLVAGLEAYQRMYKESIDNPEAFWDQVRFSFLFG